MARMSFFWHSITIRFTSMSVSFMHLVACFCTVRPLFVLVVHVDPLKKTSVPQTLLSSCSLLFCFVVLF